MSTTDYDKLADKYAPAADDMPGNRFYEYPATLALLPPLEGLDVLDAGCGAGRYTEYCRSAGANVVAFDPSLEMVNYTRQRVGEEVEVLHCATSELCDRVGGRTFDLILSCLVMHYVEDLEPEFVALRGLLKSNGKIVVSMKHTLVHDNMVRNHGYWFRGWCQIDWPVGKVFHYQRPLSEITEALSRAGLLIERLVEAKPDPELEKVDPWLFRRAQRLPCFVHLVLRKG